MHNPGDQQHTYDALMDLSRLAATVAATMIDPISQASHIVATCLLSGHKVLACGNGGSAADAQHFVAELIGRMTHERPSLPAIALSSDPSIVTALSNDYGYTQVFARQVEGLGQPGDVLLVISTSGRSPNVLCALETAHRRGLHTIALLGEGGDPLLETCNVCLHIPARNTQRVQELHTALLHAICAHVEQQVLARATAG